MGMIFLTGGMFGRADSIFINPAVEVEHFLFSPMKI